jgi:uncharacterized membrane protein YjdF
MKKILFICFSLFLISHFLGWEKFYEQFNNYDKIVHILAGASAVFFFNWILKEKGVNYSMGKTWFYSLIFLLVVSFFWEAFEYLVDNHWGRTTLTPLQIGAKDTLTDFLSNFVGGISALIILYFQK